MRGVSFGRLRSVLALGAHSDDIEIGAGATLIRLVRETPGLKVVWVVLAAEGTRGAEARASAARFLEGAGSAEVMLEGFRDGHFPQQWAEIKAFVETLKPVAPDLVLTHHGADRHQDHRTLSELAWNTFRDHAILEYEIPKWDGDLGAPNLFVPASAADAEKKIALLMDGFPSQREKHWFDPAAFRGLMRLRGLECNAAEGLAEAFHARKLRLG